MLNPIRKKLQNKKNSHKDSNSIPLNHKSRNDSVHNLKSHTTDKKSSEIPTVEFDISSSTIEKAPANTQNTIFDRKESLKKYIKASDIERNSEIINNFQP